MAGMTRPIAPKRQTETRSAVERIGAFAAAARPEHLTAEIRQLFKRNILDSIGCAIPSVAGPSLQPLRDQTEEYRALTNAGDFPKLVPLTLPSTVALARCQRRTQIHIQSFRVEALSSPAGSEGRRSTTSSCL